MKKFNLKLRISLFMALILLQSCMPDSLTKFKKDAPVKPTSSTTSGPIVDGTGSKVDFTQPTFARWGSSIDSIFSFEVGVSKIITPFSLNLDGSLNDPGNPFKISCSLDLSGDTQTRILPTGLSLDTSLCKISGAPLTAKSVITPFCSDPTKTTQTTCESTPLTWSANGCSDKDFHYQNQATCESSFNKWYPIGAAVPYRFRFNYRDADGLIYSIYATAKIGTYSKIAQLVYNQSDRLSLKVDTIPAAALASRTTKTSTGQYASKSVISANNGVGGVINYLDTNTKTISIKKFIKLTLSDALPFATGSFLSTSDQKVGKIFKKNIDNQNVVYVENISDDEIYFAEGDTVGNSATFSTKTATATILSIDETNNIRVADGGKLDNDLQYYSTKMLLSQFTNSYIANSTNNIKPIKPISEILANNGTTFTITPKLPDGLTLNPLTGVISGKFLSVVSPSIDYTITATNPLGSTSAALSLTALDAPKDLSLTTNQILTVSNTAFFVEGESLFQQIIPPLTEAPKGKILKILNGYQIAVEASSGPFQEGQSLDSGASYLSEKAFILIKDTCTNTDYDNKEDCENVALGNGIWSEGVQNYNLAIKLMGTTKAYTSYCMNGTDLTQDDCETHLSTWIEPGTCSNTTYKNQIACEDQNNYWDPASYAESSATCSDTTYTSKVTCEGAGKFWSSAKGAVIKSYNTSNECTDPSYQTQVACEGASGLWGPNTVLYLQYLTQNAISVSTVKTFYQGDNLLTGETILEIEHDYPKLKLADSTGFNIGGDITSFNVISSKPQAGGYIYNKSTTAGTNTISISEKTRAPNAPWFRMGDKLFAGERATGGTFTTIDQVTYDLLFIAERNKSIYLNPASTTSSNAIFTITPTLPTGLTLDSRTGLISGKATAITPRREYIMTMTNFVSQYSFVFALEVRDFFTLEEASGAPSFIMHKIGDTQTNRKCRINASDIINRSGVLDIRCHLEGQEEDLNFNPIKLQVTTGPGICQYVQYFPYWLWQYSPRQSSFFSGTVRTGCTNTGAVPTTDMCSGNYSANGGTGPNCDEGKITYETVTTIEGPTPGSCVDDATTLKSNYILCGGKKVNCAAGPVRDLLSDTAFSNGARGLIYQTPYGFNQSWLLSSPKSKEDRTNLRVVNSIRSNQCSTTNADVNTWATAVSTTPDTTNPLGKTTPYYTFNCMNAASQITGRIRLIVRDWDRDFKINNGIDYDDPSSTPTGVGADVDGSFMNNTATDAYGYNFNNHDDWDNNYTGAGAANYGGSCGTLGAGVDFKYPAGAL